MGPILIHNIKACFYSHYPMLKKSLLFIIGCLFVSFGIKANPKQDPYVLVASSYAAKYEWVSEFANVINREIETNYPDLQVYNEYLTTKCVFQKVAWDERMAQFYQSYPELPQLLVLIGDEAWIAFRGTAPEEWKKLPILLLGVNTLTMDYKDYQTGCQVDPDKIYETSFSFFGYNITGLYKEVNLRANISLIKQVVPNVSKIAFVSDNTFEGVINRSRFAFALEHYFPDMEMENLGGCHLTTNGLYNRMYVHEMGTVVLINSWEVDKEYRSYTTDRLVNSVKAFHPSPIFSLNDFQVKRNDLLPFMTHGYFYSYEDYLSSGISLLNKILTGTQPKDIPFTGADNKPQIYIDQEDLQRFTNCANNIPPNAVIYNRAPSFYERYKDKVWIIISVFLMMVAGLILFLIMWIKTLKERNLKEEAQKKEALANQKLKLALMAGNIFPIVWNIEKNEFYIELLPSVADQLNLEQQSKVYGFEEMFRYIPAEEHDFIFKQLNTLKSGAVSRISFEVHFDSQKVFDRCYWVNATVASIGENGLPTRILAAVMDISERKRSEVELRRAKDAAEKSDQLKSAFFANMSHEIRTPLNAIVGFSDVLAHADTQIEKEECLEIINKNNELLLQLIRDILDLSKIEAGIFDINPTHVDLKKMITQVQQDAIRKCLPGQEISISHDDTADIRLWSDPNRLMQVLGNLINNALKFTNVGEILIGYSIMPDENQIRFYVRDTGCGIPTEKLATIFDRFVKLNSFSSGTGLGLAICKNIVEHLGGEIGVISEVNKGTEFWFVIPLVQENTGVHETEPDTESFVIAKPVVSNTRKIILIAEDNISNYKLFHSILRDRYELIHAKNGLEAVSLFHDKNPHLVLMDIKMPEMDGYQSLEEIRKIEQEIPVIAVTAFAYPEDERKIKKAGFSNYLTKPIRRQSLEKMINDYI